MSRILEKSTLCLVFAAALFAMTATTSKAGLVLTGDIAQVAPPPSVLLGAVENDTSAIVFEEQMGYSLPTNIAVNFTVPGIANSGDAFNPSPGILALGTSADAYFVHADPVGNGPKSYSGTITFDSPILGIIVTSSLLSTSDATLGFPGTLYPTGLAARGLDAPDSVTWKVSPDERTVRFHFETTSAVDEFRVLVAPVPEPSSLIAGATAGILLAIYAGRRERRAAKPVVD